MYYSYSTKKFVFNTIDLEDTGTYVHRIAERKARKEVGIWKRKQTYSEKKALEQQEKDLNLDKERKDMYKKIDEMTKKLKEKYLKDYQGQQDHLQESRSSKTKKIPPKNGRMNGDTLMET